MVVGVCRISLMIHTSFSLKDKRSVLRRIKDRTRKKFNVSIAEVGENDIVNRALIGFVAVGNDRRHVNSTLDTVQQFIDELYLAEILDAELELLNY